MSKGSSNIILIGMPGAGKSTVGVVLAKIANMDFLDADLLIQGQTGKTLQSLIDELGVEGFLRVEDEVLSAIDVEGCVIATGGSAVYSRRAMRHLSNLGTVVYLEIAYESLVARLGDLHERGVVLKDGVSMSLDDLYRERRPLYERYADVIVNVEGSSITDAARKVISAVRKSD